MAKEINLLIRKNVISPAVAKVASAFQKISFIILFLFVLSSIGVFGFRFYQNKRFSDLTSQIESVKQQIEAEKSTESLYIAYVDKGKAVDGILSKRIYPDERYIQIQNAIGNEVPITQYSSSKDIINVQVSADNVSQVESITKGLLNNSGLPVRDVIMAGLDKSEGELLIDFTINLNSQ